MACCCSQHSALISVLLQNRDVTMDVWGILFHSQDCEVVENKERKKTCSPPGACCVQTAPGILSCSKLQHISLAFFFLPPGWLFQSSQLYRVSGPTWGYLIFRTADCLHVWINFALNKWLEVVADMFNIICENTLMSLRKESSLHLNFFLYLFMHVSDLLRALLLLLFNRSVVSDSL